MKQKMQKIDERYVVVEEAILDAFIQVMKEKPTDAITVADVIKKAGIVRSTFYNHYENIPDLINGLEDKTIERIFGFMENFHPRNDREICEKYFHNLCEYTMKNPFLADLLRSPKGDSFLEKAMSMFHRYVSQTSSNLRLTPGDQEQASYAIACAIGCSIGVLHKWTSENFATSMDLIVSLLTDVFMKSLLPLMS